jgi:hypothetical protein
MKTLNERDNKMCLYVSIIVMLAFGLMFVNTIFADNFTADFETGDLTGWTNTGDAFDFQPTKGDNPTARDRGQPSQHQGDWWIGGYEKYQEKTGQTAGDIQGDGPQGTLTSTEFKIVGEKINFLIGGGTHPTSDSSGATAVVLLVNDKVVRESTGKNTETMSREEWDVSDLNGQMAQLQIIDENPGGWGHINADDFNQVDAAGNRIPFTSTGVGVDLRGKLAISWGALKTSY